MLGAIAGDIIGSCFEGHPGPPSDFTLFHPACRFTDDTVCSLAVAEAMDGMPANVAEIARAQLPADLRGVLERFEQAIGHRF